MTAGGSQSRPPLRPQAGDSLYLLHNIVMCIFDLYILAIGLSLSRDDYIVHLLKQWHAI